MVLNKAKERQLRDVFNAFDLDNNGFIEKEEFLNLGRARRAGSGLKKGVGAATGKWTEAKNERLMARVDTNRDGKVQWSEFFIYFSEVWHGGMELFDDKDFTTTIQHFFAVALECGKEAKPTASPSTAEDRLSDLKQVFRAFDIDGSGFIGAQELLALGKARRSSGQKQGEWTEAQNDRLLKRITKDNGASGDISLEEFSSFFNDQLPQDKPGFEREIAKFREVAAIVSKKWSTRSSSPSTSAPRASVTTRVPRKSPGGSSLLDRYDRYSSPSKTPVKESPKKDSRESSAKRRQRRTPLREIFSAIDLTRTGQIEASELRQLGPHVKRLAHKCGEVVSEELFMDSLEEDLPKGPEEFEEATNQMLLVAKAIRTAKEEARRARRCEALSCVFSAVDLDMRGFVTRQELLELGGVPTPGYLRRGDWNESKSRGFCDRSDPSTPGQYTLEEFVAGLEKSLTLAEGQFGSNMEDMMAASQAIQSNREKDREYQLAKMDPIERAVYEAEDATRRARGEQSSAQQAEAVAARKSQAAAESTQRAQASEDAAGQSAVLASNERQDSEAENAAALAARAGAEQLLAIAQEQLRAAQELQEAQSTSERDASDKADKSVTQLSAAERAALAASEAHAAKKKAQDKRLAEVLELERQLAAAKERLVQATEETSQAAHEEANKVAIVDAAKSHQAKAADSLTVARDLLQQAKQDTAAKSDEATQSELELRREVKKSAEAIRAHEARLAAEKAAGEALQQAHDARTAAEQAELEAARALQDAKLAVLSGSSWVQVRLQEETAARGWWEAHRGRVAAEEAHVAASKSEDAARQAQLRSDWAGNVAGISTFGIDADRTSDLSGEASSKKNGAVQARAHADKLHQEALKLAAVAQGLTQQAEHAKAQCTASEAQSESKRSAVLAQMEAERRAEQEQAQAARKAEQEKQEEAERLAERAAMEAKKAELAAQKKLEEEAALAAAEQQAAQQMEAARKKAEADARQAKVLQAKADEQARKKAEADAVLAERQKSQRAANAKRAAMEAAASKARESGRVQQVQQVFAMFDADRDRKVDQQEFFKVVRLFEGDKFTEKMGAFVFNKIDSDKSGFIDEGEFIVFIRDQTRKLSDAQFNRMIADLVNAAKSAEAERAAAAAQKKKAQAELAGMWTKSADRTQQIHEAFKAMDADRNRAVDVHEFFEVGKLVHDAAGNTNSTWTMDKCRKIFGKIDTDNDGTIDESEFTIFLKDITKNKTDQQFAAMIASYKTMGLRASKTPQKEQQPAPTPAAPEAGFFRKPEQPPKPEQPLAAGSDLVHLFVAEIEAAMHSQGLEPSVDSLKKAGERGGLWDDFGDWSLAKCKKAEAGNQFSKLSSEELHQKASQYMQLGRAEETKSALAKMLKKAQGKGGEPKGPKGGKGGKGPPKGGPGLSEELRNSMTAQGASGARNPPVSFGAADLLNVKLKKAPKKEAPKEEAPKEEAPKEEAPKEEAPKEEAPKVEAPKEEAPKEEAPKEAKPAAARYTAEMAAADEARKAQEKAEMEAELQAMKEKQQAELLKDSSSDKSAKREKMKGMSDEELIADSLGMSVQEYRKQFLGEAGAPEPEKELSVGEAKFRELDVGNKGYLTWEDLGAFSKWLYAAVTGGKVLPEADVEREARKVADKLDTDRDGKVQLDEFAPFFETRKAQMDKAASRRKSTDGK